MVKEHNETVDLSSGGPEPVSPGPRVSFHFAPLGPKEDSGRFAVFLDPESSEFEEQANQTFPVF